LNIRPIQFPVAGRMVICTFKNEDSLGHTWVVCDDGSTQDKRKCALILSYPEKQGDRRLVITQVDYRIQSFFTQSRHLANKGVQ
jgi:hypothetical protein